MTRSPCRSSPCVRTRLPLLLLLALPGGCQSVAGRPQAPSLFRCVIAGEAPQWLRVDPRLRQVQVLDPATREVKRTIVTVEPPPELGGGIIDDSTVTITGQEIRWEESMYRPQFSRESHRIDLRTLVFRSSWSVQVDAGPEISETISEGRCERLDALPDAAR